MKKIIMALFCCLTTAASFAVTVGTSAPDFTGQGSDGKIYRLSDFRGKFVVLEWHNQGCPFVKKHYDSGHMQKLQHKWTHKGVVWFSVVSSAEGKQGYLSEEKENVYLKEKDAYPTAALLDPNGIIGHLYDAKTSPHMFIVNPEGILIYNGAIDDKPSTDLADIPTANNYIDTALKEAMDGMTVTVSAVPPYGCSIKYKE